MATLAPIGKLQGLTRLYMVHLPKVTRFDPLASLSRLEELTLETLPGWDASGKTLSVESLRPLARLHKLRLLSLAGVVACDGDLSALSSLSELRQLNTANRYSQEQFARLSGALPEAKGGFLAPFLDLGIRCGKCGSGKVMLSGCDVKNPKVVCPTCRKKKFDETVAKFEVFRAAAAAGR